MKRIIIIILTFCLFASCVDKRGESITFLFEPEQASLIRDSLIKLRDIAEEYFIMQNKVDPYGNAIVLTARRDLWIDGKFCKWSDLEANKDSVFQANLEMNLYFLDEKGFFPLFKFLNDNFIRGIYYYLEGASEFPYGGRPFFFRVLAHKRIVIKSDFYAMPKEYREFLLTYNLITDDKEGLLLLSDKGDVLLRLYGAWGDKMDKAPEKWRRPTDEVFYK